MSPLWVLPLVVLAVGSIAVAVVARRLAAEASSLRPGLDDLRRLAADAQAAVAEGESLRLRSMEVGDLRARAWAARRVLHDRGPGDDDR